VPRSLVTNGVLLAARAADLAALDPTGVTVSIDSAEAARHDRLRGKRGAFEATVEGLRALAAIKSFAPRMTVSSVLFPHRRSYLETMPELLAACGVRHWAVSPLLEVARGHVGGPVAPSDEIIDDVLWLHAKAAAVGIELVLDDELDSLQTRKEDYHSFTIRRFDRPDGLVRLGPSGACSVGREILRQIDDSAEIWRPTEDPVAFLAHAREAARLRAEAA
jgi:sulfatase maturation enzyme AslB (radical SAM superfamily)